MVEKYHLMYIFLTPWTSCTPATGERRGHTLSLYHFGSHAEWWGTNSRRPVTAAWSAYEERASDLRKLRLLAWFSCCQMIQVQVALRPQCVGRRERGCGSGGRVVPPLGGSSRDGRRTRPPALPNWASTTAARAPSALLRRELISEVGWVRAAPPPFHGASLRPPRRGELLLGLVLLLPLPRSPAAAVMAVRVRCVGSSRELRWERRAPSPSAAIATRTLTASLHDR